MSLSSVALYRKYRPSAFSEVKGQGHIVSVLEGAIEKNTIPHALLFSGGRGTGKTTLARLFARAVGTHDLDIYEIDAASNRGIDDIRELREAVHAAPYESTYKVYIIDEVHMLTKEAFNALLKTLEEPPAHVLFILATTEEEKLLDTIKSRCQVFRFKSPTRHMLSQVVVEVAKKEGFNLEPAAADLIAVAADGSFRDALGITQKVILASADEIGSADEVAAIIGAPRHVFIISILEALKDKNTKKGLEAIQQAHNEHVDMKLFMHMLLEYIRICVLIRHTPAKKDEYLTQCSDEVRELLLDIAENYARCVNSHTLLRLLDASAQIARSPLPHLPLEIVMMELTEKVSQDTL